MKQILLGFQPVISTTGEELFRAIQNQLRESGLDIAEMTGYGSDGASNMVGQHNSLWSRLKECAPHVVQMKCICHSPALCVAQGFDHLPSNLGFMTKEIPK